MVLIINQHKKGLSRKHLVEACHEALQRMQLDYLDLYFCHRPDKTVPMEEVVWTMNILNSTGKDFILGHQRMECTGDHGSTYGSRKVSFDRPFS